MGQLLLIIAIGSVPILLWGTYFYVKNPRKQPLGEIFKIFALGTLSIIPVLIFHQWFLDKFVGALEGLWPALEGLFLGAILELVLLFLFIVIFIIVFAFLHSISLTVFRKLPWKENFTIVYKRLYNLTPILVFFSLFLVLELIFELGLRDSFVLSVGGSTIIFAVMEEYFKYIINPFLVYKKINSIGTAMVHALYVGLAFAFVENALFFYIHYGSADFMTIFIYRSLFTTLLHVCASGLLGYFYGLSIFAESMLTNYEIEKSKYSIPKWLRGLLRKKTFFRSSTITQGFFLAALAHSLFNLLLQLNMRTAAAVLVIALTIVIVILLRSKPSQVQYGLVGSSVMPEEDFEKLRLQISVLQHTSEIQKSRAEQSSKPTTNSF